MEKKKLYKSTTDKKIFGVCGGLAEYLGIDATIIRVVVAILILCVGVGLLPYLICALVLPTKPEEPVETPSEVIVDEKTES